jgi:hypothetical protein
MNTKHLSLFLSCLVLSLLVLTQSARAVQVVVEVESMAPKDGIFFTPVWLGFHDGSFDLFDAGRIIPPGSAVERAFEDGDVEALQNEFRASVADGVDGFAVAPEGFPDVPLFEPGEQSRTVFDLDPKDNRYLSFAAMVLPSNDAFIANDNPEAIELFDAGGRFKGSQTITIVGADVWDAGTELNNEEQAALLNQSEPGAGTRTADPVARHPGFLGSYANPAVGTKPIILGSSINGDVRFDPVAADFTQPGAVICQITIIPEPATLVLLAAGGLALLRTRRCL